MKSSDLLIKDLGKFVDTSSIGVLSPVLPELQLGEGLVAEGGGHDERGVSSGASEVEETT